VKASQAFEMKAYMGGMATIWSTLTRLISLIRIRTPYKAKKKIQ
jgi:hypothetical protein